MAITFGGTALLETMPGETYQPRQRLSISTEHTSHFNAGPEFEESEDDSDDSSEEMDIENKFPDVEHMSVITAEESDPWLPKIVLSLDGGSHRNFSTLLILQALMKKIEQFEQKTDPTISDSARSREFHLPSTNSRPPSDSRFRPCHYFDYIGGASTGGLIAILLGRMRRPVDEALEIFLQFSQTMFPNFPRGMGISRLPRALNNKATRSEKFAAQLDWSKPTDSSPEEDGQRFVSDSLRCRTIICAMEKTRLEDQGLGLRPYLFRSYAHEARDESSYLRNPGGATDRSTADVAKAAVAASQFQNFEQHGYYDSGPGLNNPSLELYNEITSLHDPDNLALFISIGCGASKTKDPSSPQSNSRAWKLKASFKRQEKELSLGADAVHRRMHRKSRSPVSAFEYFRFDVKENIPESSLGNWQSIQPGRHALKKIAAATDAYLAQPEVDNRLHECAEQLVHRRKLRAETLQWESFALGVRYCCPHLVQCQVQKDKVRFATRDVLLDHLRTVHKEPPPDANNFERINSLLDRGRINSDRSDGS
ncbi:uncharacterized protein PV07_06328 [Cladophialophora immunda]|uniref:PNPLA domain-containing protein n=1 Tax=Cladophialophora immunda TaxID=569365 RepID=A0A0D2D4I6_9EURO|nr:uncharacterized protein PV07_06328 [Cladophialophora immunda]KIW30594.1 hypothetical protein PV07_06328 [Cladophialophora immunda]OQU99583.1 hypothetical protein CLAIMM_05193 [Cladophialophora immunda]